MQSYLNTGVTILYPQPTQLITLLDLLEATTSRKKIFDVALAATLKEHKIEGLYTMNTKDFDEFKFLDVINPLVSS